MPPEKNSVLFLHNITKVIIKSPLRNCELIKEKNSVRIIENGITKERKSWKIKQKNSSFDGKNYELKIAYSGKLDDDKNILYSFFRTNVKFPFPALIHCTFDLNENRNYLIKSEENNFLIGELIQLMIETAIEITKSSKPSWKALKLLIGGEFDDLVLNDFNFNGKLKEEIKKNKLFPTISNKYISINENPIFLKNEFSDILPSKYLPNLAIHTTDKDVISYIKKELGGLSNIDINLFFEKLTTVSKKENLKFAQRSKLIKYVNSEFGDKIQGYQNSLELFIDTEKKIINSSKSIFISPSPSSLKLDIPNYVNLGFIHPRLLDDLKIDFDEKENDELAKKLKNFNIKRYRFEEVISQIISEANKIINDENKEDVISSLFKCLYNYYIGSNLQHYLMSIIAVEIPIFNKNGRIIKLSSTNSLYFGAEYGNEILENLLKKNDQFLCSPDKINLKSDEKIKDFFRWIGIKDSLALTSKYIDSNDNYGKSIIGNIQQFPHKCNNLDLATIDKIKQREIPTSFGFRIETIDNLDQIIAYSEFIDLIVWFLRDKLAIDLIKKEEENIDYISLRFPKQKDNRSIKNYSFTSYFHWQLKNVKWIKTKINQKQKISDCFISDKIAENLLVYLNKPHFDINDSRLKKHNISENEIYELFSKLGICKEINQISKSLIYNLFLKLPEIEVDNSEILSFYNLIAGSIDNNLHSSEKYTFTQKGKLLAKTADTLEYLDIKNIYYVTKSSYPKNLISKLPILHIDNKFDERKIKNIFSVNLLESINIAIEGEPQKHRLHNEFINEFNTLKPYIYSFFIDSDIEHKKLELLKNLQIILCENIETVTSIDGNRIKFDIVNYEYINLANSYYVCINNSVTHLKSDFKFRAIVAEIITDFISSPDYKSDLRELYSLEENQRYEFLESSLKEDAMVKLENAQRLFGKYISPEIRFWNIIAEIKKQPISDFLDNDDIKFIMGNFIFETVKSKSNNPKIIDLFKKLELDIDDFNEMSSEYIDLTQYYREEINLRLQKVEKQKQSKLFEILSSKSIAEKKGFYSKITENPTGINQNSVKFSIEDYLNNFLSGLFAYAITYGQVEKFSINNDFNDLYKENLNNFEKELELKYRFLQSKLLSSNENKSLIYFSEFDELNKIIKGMYDFKYQNKEAKSGNINVDLNGKNLEDYTYTDLFGVCKEDLDEYKIENISISEQLSTERKSKSHFNQKKFTASKNNEVHGFIGESYVYNILKNKYKSVSWVSANAVKANIISSGNDSLGYDISYINENNETQYIEVKSSVKEDMVFNISKSEVNFGEDNCDNYNIIFITHVNQKHRKLFCIQKPFKYKKGENFYNNSKFSVENSNFKVAFEKK